MGPANGTKGFRLQYPMPLSHCYPARLGHFPRPFGILTRAMEDWFTFGLQERFADFIMAKKLGVPAVGTKVDFVSPARFGDQLKIELRVLRLGRASIELAIDSFVADRPCFKAH